jgi:hypothetical protein
LLILCAASIFLPFSICMFTMLFTFIYALRKHDKIMQIFTPPHSKWFFVFFILEMAVGIIYRNWFGLNVLELIFLLVLFGFYIQSLMTDELCRNMIQAMAIGSLAAAAAAFLQKTPDILYRSVSFFANANYYAYSCEIVILASVYAIYRYGSNPLYYIAIAANIDGIIASGCRTAWPALFCGIIIIMLCLKKRLHLLIFSVTGIIIGIITFCLPRLLFPRFKSFINDKALRIMIWETSLGYIKSHPLFGQGMFSYYTLSVGRAHDFHAHNLILDMLVNFGLVGTALITVFAVFAIRGFIRGLRIKPACALSLGVITASFVHGFTDIPFLGLQTGSLLIIIISLAGSCGNLPASKNIS